MLERRKIFSAIIRIWGVRVSIFPRPAGGCLESPVWTMEMLEMSPIDRNNHLASDTPELANFTDNFNLQLTPLFIFGYCLIQYKSAFYWEGSGKNSGGWSERTASPWPILKTNCLNFINKQWRDGGGGEGLRQGKCFMKYLFLYPEEVCRDSRTSRQTSPDKPPI